MKRLLQLIFFFLFSAKGFSQFHKDIDIQKELKLFYTDTIHGKIYFGNYEPTGITLCPDSSYAISTILSIDFPELYDTTDLESDFKKYSERLKPYESKEHISSGSVLKLNSDLTKKWEVIFKDRRVNDIFSLDSSSLIVSGERIDRKVIWIAKLDNKDGSIIWLKEFKVGYNLSTCGLNYTNDNFYILGETERKVFFDIKKHYGVKKIEFFKQTQMQLNLILLCVSKDGDLKWKKKIDPKKKRNSFEYSFASTATDHYILASIDNYKQQKGKNKKEFVFYTIKTNGKVKTKKSVDFNNMFYSANNLILSKTKLFCDTIKTYIQTNSNFTQTDSFSILTDRKDIRLKSIFKAANNYYMYGSIQINNCDFLICNMNEKFQITDYRVHNDSDYNQIVSLTEAYNKNLLLIGWSYKTDEKTGHIFRYMNIIEFKKFDNPNTK